VSLPARVVVPDRVVGRRGLSKRLQRRIRSFAEALFATESGPPSDDRLDWLLEELDDFVRQAGSQAGLVVRMTAFVVTWLAPLFVLRPVPFGWLGWRTRVRALERMEGSFAGLPLLAGRAMLCFIYYEHPDAVREIDADGLCKSTPGGPP
jgi:hypothetical protein